MAEPTFCSGLADVVSRYDGFVLDQWGVIHDGRNAFADALDCLARLRALDKRIVLLSNVGRRATDIRARLATMGVPAELYDDVVTAGEVAHHALVARSLPGFAELGERCLLWSRHGDRSLVEGLELQLVDEVDAAELILLAGTDEGARLEDFGAALERAAARDLPLLCANPDVLVVRPGEGIAMAPGAVARHYESLGGRVLWIGKPYELVYDWCLEALGRPASERVLAIGDSMAHDIAGATAHGLASALVMAGIHRPIFDLGRGAGANRAALAHLAETYGVRPTWVLPRLRWSGV